jgi:hypothetical protein
MSADAKGERMTDWTAERDHLWSKTVRHRGWALVLRVFPDDDNDPSGSWVWEVIELEGECDELEVGLGEALTREAAMAAAEAAATQA